MSEKSKSLASELRSSAERISKQKAKQRIINKCYIFVFSICLTTMLLGRSLVDASTQQQAEEIEKEDLNTDNVDKEIYVFF